jgi:crotonobetainyl-CoA:carnitine CoA-transferase CaiB-like acyl-CoA transferase
VGARAKNNDAWFEVRGAPLTERTTDEWLALFQRADIASQPCHTLEQLVHDPHLAAVRLLGDEDHPVEGRTVAIRPTIRFDEKYAPAGDFAQPMGWATQSILEELGMKPSSAESG